MIAERPPIETPILWDTLTARRCVSALWWDLNALLGTLDTFDKPSVRHPQLVAADRAIWQAWAAHDLAGVGQAVAGYQATYRRLAGRDV